MNSLFLQFVMAGLDPAIHAKGQGVSSPTIISAEGRGSPGQARG
jgi:hypothetical protein